jgi:tetratricopeptide (TPR) repeat protein
VRVDPRAGAFRSSTRPELRRSLSPKFADHLPRFSVIADSTLISRNHLAVAYREAGRFKEAIPLLKETAADFERLEGPHNPDTLRARHDLGVSYRKAGRLKEAIALLEQTVADRERILKPHHYHPDTLVSRDELAVAYRKAGRLKEAIALLEQTVARREQWFGPDHDTTLAAKADLARTRAQQRR